MAVVMYVRCREGIESKVRQGRNVSYEMAGEERETYHKRGRDQ